ncbi:hypothetical protein Ptr902_11401 [Pyrenophora tritici-repentis]|nr:hypothetical protein Ptr902_11401 [Pyrenophora tritici-repentis]
MSFLNLLAEAKGNAAPIKFKTIPKPSTASKPVSTSTKVASSASTTSKSPTTSKPIPKKPASTSTAPKPSTAPSSTSNQPAKTPLLAHRRDTTKPAVASTVSNHTAQAKPDATDRIISRVANPVVERSPIRKQRADIPPPRPLYSRRGNRVENRATLRHPRKDPTTPQKNMNKNIAKALTPQSKFKAQTAAQNQTRTQRPSWRRNYNQYPPPAPVMPNPTRYEFLMPFSRKPERKPKRCLIKAEYQTMRCVDLIHEAKFRGLELDSQDRSYLADLLLIDDMAYAELMDKLGNKQEAIEYAQGEVAHYNQGLRRKRAVAEAAKEQAMREWNEKQQWFRVDAEQVATKEVEEEVEEKKPTVEAQGQEKIQESQDPGYSYEHEARPATSGSTAEEQPKGNKRARPSDDDDNEESNPKKKARHSTPQNTTEDSKPLAKDDKPVKKTNLSRVVKANDPPTALPRAIQAHISKTPSFKKEDIEMKNSDETTIAEHAKGVAVKIKRKKASAPKPLQRTHYTHSDTDDEEMKYEGHDGEEEESEEDDFIVDDLAYKSKRKSKVSAMARSNLFSGMR